MPIYVDRQRRRGCWAIALVASGALGSANTGNLVEPVSRTVFAAETQHERVVFTCLGVGLRRRLFIREYAVTFCMETTDLAATLEPYTSPKDPAPLEALRGNGMLFEALAHAPGGKLVELRLLHDAHGAALAESFGRVLAGDVPAHKLAALREAVPSKLTEGAVVRLASTADGTLSIEADGRVERVRDAELATKVWRVWLGDRSATPSLKEDIAQRLAAGGES